MADIYKIKIGDDTHNLPFLPLNGGTMNSDANIIFPSTSQIVATTLSTSNAVHTINWYKGSSKPTEKYPAHLGWHNEGGSNNKGSILLIPQPSDTESWRGNIGLYISNDSLKFNGTQVSLVGHNHDNRYLQSLPTHSHDYLPLTGGTLTSNLKIDVATGTDFFDSIGLKLHRSNATNEQYGVNLALTAYNNVGGIIGAGGYGMTYSVYDGTTSTKYLSVDTSGKPTFEKFTTFKADIDGHAYYCNENNSSFTPTNIFGHYMWSNVVQFTKRDLDNKFIKSLWDIDLTNEKHNILAPVSIKGDCDITGTLKIKRSAAAIQYLNASGTEQGWMGFSAKDDPRVWTADGTTSYSIVHGGNISTSLSSQRYVFRHRYAADLTNKDMNYANNMFGSWAKGDDAEHKNNPEPIYGAYISFGTVASSDDSTTRNQTGQIGIDCWTDLGRMYVRARKAGDKDVSIFGDWKKVAFVSDIPTNNNQLTNGAGYTTATGHNHDSYYLKLLGGSMNGNITIPNTSSIIYTTNTTSNWISCLTLYKGTTTSGKKYEAGIGWHNTGDTNGALTLIPHAQDSDPWLAGVGLYISKTSLKFNGTNVSLSGHTHTSIKDIGNSTNTTFAYSKAGLAYADYTWLAGWNGYELRAVAKTQFAQASHTHSNYLTAVPANISVTSISATSNGCGAIGASGTRFTYGYFSQQVHAAGGFFESSDERLKDIQAPLTTDLDKLSQLRKVYFKWKEDPKDTHIGVIAQDIKKLYPEIVTETDEGTLNVDYSKLSVIALDAVDQLNNELKEVKEKLNKVLNALNL